MELCRSIRLDRQFVDKVDFFDTRSCEGITNAFVESNRCRCSIFSSSVVSRDTRQIACIRDKEIDRSKYSLILHSIQ